MKHNLSIIVLLFCSSILYGQDTGINFEQTGWQQIKEKAQKENKNIFLDAYAEWCGPCKWMSKNTFTNPEVAEYYNTNFINAKIDMEKGEGIELAKKYEVIAYPSLLYISPEGEIIHRACGAAPPEAFIEMAKTALDNNSNLASYVKKYKEREVNSEFLYDYATVLHKACVPVNDLVVEYLSSQPNESLKSDNNWKIIRDYLKDYDSEPFQYLLANKDEFAKVYSEKAVEEKIFQVYQTALFEFEARNDKKALAELKRKIRGSAHPDAEKIILNSELKSYERKKAWDEYAKVAEVYAEKYAWDDSHFLNNIAWVYYENISDKEHLKKAVRWTERSISLKKGYYNTDTLAALHFKLGNKNEAKKAAEEAIELAKENGDDFEETQLLLDKINNLN